MFLSKSILTEPEKKLGQDKWNQGLKGPHDLVQLRLPRIIASNDPEECCFSAVGLPSAVGLSPVLTVQTCLLPLHLPDLLLVRFAQGGGDWGWMVVSVSGDFQD